MLFHTKFCETKPPLLRPRLFNACARCNRLVAVFLAPRVRIKGLAVVSRNARPNVRIYKPMRKKVKLSVMADG